ncbi:MAG TPA: flagellar biosynthetic protein FliO [Thermoanaerobaculia bacterium]|nr:flagellar biosynthetic protein FliO [Thermoanaerobaculia bacterium]
MAGELWMLLRVVLSLAVVLALAVVVLRFGLPRLMHLQASSQGKRLQVLESVPLDRQHRVALVRVGGKEYLVAFGGGEVTTLDAWPAGHEAQPPQALAEGGA